MATLQSGKCFTVPTFFGMCCRSEWPERMYIYKWHEVDQTKHEIFCSYCLQWNTSQSKFRNHYFLFLFAFSILSQLFLIWGCTSVHSTMFSLFLFPNILPSVLVSLHTTFLLQVFFVLSSYSTIFFSHFLPYLYSLYILPSLKFVHYIKKLFKLSNTLDHIAY